VKTLLTQHTDLSERLRALIADLRAYDAQLNRLVLRIEGTVREAYNSGILDAANHVANSDSADARRLAINITNLKKVI
jgi:hypothetical protein